MHWCERLGVYGLVVHVGSGKGTLAREEGLDLVIDGIGQVLSRSSDVRFLIENTAGMGSSIGSDFADIGAIVERLGRDSRLGVCLDTAHTFEAGYDIRTAEGVDAVFATFDREVGLEHLAALHVNDSKSPFGSNFDRHENLGSGHIGEEPLGWLVTHPAVQNLPLYLEVPGVAGRGPDRENVEILRRLAQQPPLPPPSGAVVAPPEEEALVIP
jgi:deoxyribonuclease-4